MEGTAFLSKLVYVFIWHGHTKWYQSSKKVIPTQTYYFYTQRHADTALTALEGDGQQCKAAPAWTASTEPDGNGSLETSALTRAILLQTIKETVLRASISPNTNKKKKRIFHSSVTLN